jgi:hypothetical protein
MSDTHSKLNSDDDRPLSEVFFTWTDEEKNAFIRQQLADSVAAYGPLIPDERVLGYDARPWPPPPADWPRDRREQFLLKPDATTPLSTDSMVWSSAFTEHPDLARNRPAFVGPIQDLWANLAELRTHLGEDRPACLLVAVTLVCGPCRDDERKSWDARIVDIVPPRVDPAWELLGYDVSDEYLLSGLSNCGYDAAAIEQLRQTWGPHLNDHHLFTSMDLAADFVALSDERVPEHAPFFIYGIYAIPR